MTESEAEEWNVLNSLWRKPDTQEKPHWTWIEGQWWAYYYTQGLWITQRGWHDVRA